jgi:ubiquinol-cytochrome c reductase iron-sulfur subunit
VNDDARGATGARVAFAAFAVSSLCLLALAVVYALGGQPQAEGALLGAGLIALGLGLVLWAHWLMPRGPFEQRRHELAGSEGELAALEETLEHPAGMSRRKLLVGGLAGAVGALCVALVFPIRSLGPNPGSSLLRTPWRRGRRAITGDGRPVRAADVPLDGLVTVFPDGHPDSADGQVVLMRVRAERLHLSPERAGWAPDGLIAYSKVCTHAGCPVGLFDPRRGQLLCPCHQSGYVVAQSDFHEPIGPSFWNRR